MVLLRRGLAGEASSGADRCGQVSHGMAGVVSREKVRSGVLMSGFAGELWLGWARRVRFSQAWFGESGGVRRGAFRCVMVMFCLVMYIKAGMA